MQTFYQEPLDYRMETSETNISALQNDVSDLNETVTSLSGSQWRILYLDYTSQPFGALNTGANYSQGKGFVFSKSVSWQNIFPLALAQTDNVETHVVPISNTEGKVQATNLRNTTVSACIIRLYILTNDPNLTVSWVA